jgi:hypothetical protein
VVVTPWFHARDCLLAPRILRSASALSLTELSCVEPYVYFWSVCNVTLYSMGARRVVYFYSSYDASSLQDQAHTVVTEGSG